MTVEAFFLARPNGQRLGVFHPTVGIVPRGAVLHLAAFAEELNKSRRMVALQAAALAQAGYATLLLDLDGCGDASGDLDGASWQGWVDDALAGARWLAERVPAPLWLWGHRAGALVASAAAARLDSPPNLLLWHPALSGQLVLQQFLRLRAAARLLDGQAKGVLDMLKEALGRGETVEVAGYPLPPALADGLAKATLSPPTSPERVARLAWLELSSRPDAELSPAAGQALARWRAAGWQAEARVVNGPAFWQTSEIEHAPALLLATLDAMARLEATQHAAPSVPAHTP